jgi:hypothetical protein
MDGMDYDPMVMDGEPEQPQVTISAVRPLPEPCILAMALFSRIV